MKIWLFSDVHLLHGDVPIEKVLPEIPEADICVVPGDLVEGDPVAGVHWLARFIRPSMQVVYTLGNHEFYSRHSSMERARRQATRAAEDLGIHLLDDTHVTVSGVNFYGSTLWSDYDILARGNLGERQRAMDVTGYALNDFRLIRPWEGSAELWTPEMARAQHLASRQWLDSELARGSGRKVVVSHHAPHPFSIAPQFATDLVTSGFVSDLSEVIERRQPELWIHGHTHSSFDYTIGETRIICNPLGYRYEYVPAFDPELVIDI